MKMIEAVIEKYAAGTNSSPEHRSCPNPNLGSLDSPSPKKNQKPKRMKWACEEYKQVMSFLSSIKWTKRQQHNTHLWEKAVAELRPYIDANKLANFWRDIMNKKRLREAEMRDILKTVRKQTKIENPKYEMQKIVISI